MRNPFVLLGVGVLELFFAATCCGRQADFAVLGDLPGGYVASEPWATSDDGTVVVGHSWISFEEIEAFRWGPESGMVGLGDLPGGDFFSEAEAVSGDGRVIAGEGVGEAGARAWQLIDGAMTALPLPNIPVDHTSLRAMSRNGRFKTGAVVNQQPGGELVLWDGMLPRVLTFEAQQRPYVTDLSDDARIMVGSRGLPPNGSMAVRAVGGVLEDLGDLPGGRVQSYAGGMTPDGRIVVGSGFETIMDDRAFFWTRERRLVPLPNNVEGHRPVSADGVSSDGWVIVGVLAVGFSQTTYVWNPLDGARSLKGILEGEGLSLDGLNPRYPTDVTPDGTIVVGSVSTPNGNLAFRARIPPFCYADCDRSTGRGVLDTLDFLEFQRRFALQDLYSDCDQNAQYDIFDYLCFLNHFAAGCP